jgi:hypothetical protein
MFWQILPLLIIIKVLGSQLVLHAGKQVVVAQSKTRALRIVIKQVLDEMCPAVLHSEQLYLDAHCHEHAIHQISGCHTFCSE